MDRRQVRHSESYKHDRQKSVHNSKKSNSRVKTALIIVAAFCAIAILTALVAQVRVTKIQVDGTSFASQVQVTAEKALANQLFGSNLLLMRSRGVKADVISSNGDQVAEVTVKKDYIHRTLIIKAVDRQPAVQWQSNNKLYEVDQTGKVTKQVTVRNKLPLVVDETNVQVEPLTQVTTPTFLNFIAHLQQELNKTTNLIPLRYRLRSTTKEVLVDTNKNFYVLFDTDAKPSDQLQSVKRVLELAKSKNQLPTSYVDVRIAYKAYYK